MNAMSNKIDIAMNFEASAAVGAVTCSQGGVPINGGHIQYWMSQVREARAERDTAITDGNDRIAELNAEIAKLRAERDAAARDMRERAMSAVQDLRVRTASNFVDANCRGQRGIDRCDALYDAYNAIRALPDTPGDQQP